jgi:hypothetical protein
MLWAAHIFPDLQTNLFNLQLEQQFKEVFLSDFYDPVDNYFQSISSKYVKAFGSEEDFPYQLFKPLYYMIWLPLLFGSRSRKLSVNHLLTWLHWKHEFTGTPWPGNNVRDHPGMIQVFLGHTGGLDTDGNELPRLVYVSREKRPGFNHHKKAGAMNSLVRVSAVLTNARYMLNLDCDHYINNSRALRESMCFMMDPTVGKKVCYVQFPQRFDGIDRHDRYANSCSEDSLLCQSLLEKSSEPLSAEDDVKVCDICGDTGYEEMLAVCSMCNDGAEHTYCMPSMLDKVSESDWLCESCKLQQNASVKW